MVIISRRLRIFPALFLAVALLFATTAGPAWADELDDAKASGAVGETYRGYIAPVAGATPAVSALVERINAGRRAKYESIASENNISLEQVELLAGERVLARTGPGTYIMDQSGAWAQK